MCFFNRPIDHQSTSNGRLKPVMTTGLVNMHNGQSLANLAPCLKMSPEYYEMLSNIKKQEQRPAGSKINLIQILVCSWFRDRFGKSTLLEKGHAPR